MKLLILSDLHLEFHYFPPPKTDADIIILAGDIHTGENGVQWAIDTFGGKPVLYINGSHEFYNNTYPKLIEKQKKVAEGTNVHILENDSYDSGNIRFFGCTLWTDLALIDGDPHIGSTAAISVMADYRFIRVEPKNRLLQPQDTISYHKHSISWLKEQLLSSNKNNVIITHHVPLPQSLDPKYRNSKVNAAFASDLHALIDEYCPLLWIHGHTHRACDYMYNKTHIICNPRGYPDETDTHFRTNLCVPI